MRRGLGQGRTAVIRIARSLAAWFEQHLGAIAGDVIVFLITARAAEHHSTDWLTRTLIIASGVSVAAAFWNGYLRHFAQVTASATAVLSGGLLSLTVGLALDKAQQTDEDPVLVALLLSFCVSGAVSVWTRLRAWQDTKQAMQREAALRAEEHETVKQELAALQSKLDEVLREREVEAARARMPAAWWRRGS